MPVPAGGDNPPSSIIPAGAYASPADLAAVPGAPDPVPDNVDTLLVRASRAINRALLTSVYDADDADVIVALRDATVEQVLGTLAGGDDSGLGVATSVGSFQIGKLQVQKTSSTANGQAPTTSGIVDQAWSILQTAGLTGHAPWVL
jgi:hypothetical protein